MVCQALYGLKRLAAAIAEEVVGMLAVAEERRAAVAVVAMGLVERRLSALCVIASRLAEL
ncbi:hypothetical protein [Acidocella aminolytica]|uniref:Transposase n=1 Tax=Acidocella aminolytica 101 = DSM 11237 TaxID=1120923 RepID=A0A0D6PH10_9PROT|nr:hypothetical protein [Acidocella aminolytica]GAN80957.1 hypothetical protein Aam_066_021 [Acidocella aminolytica 101 = DSM 11237]GBQ43343.1 hypothetical protein AA11237_3257 [Acidocella aminolytica 101 = DSM 11237]